ncbi:MAG: molybdopterin-synthase adenylyltransferase MoeB [Gammaproteobacteria bacterium]|nr:molybdopterin-synthase adenylyltransferase MoeB [Gammaproteobacteria bacterium]
MLTDTQLLRYSRQIMLPDLDVAGQERLLQARVLIVGLGGLGCPAALYLAAAGVGSLVLADGDVVELSNLQRQIAHGEADLGLAKVTSAANSIAALNRETVVKTLAQRLDYEELLRELAQIDLVVDASDSFATRFAVNRACVETAVPLVSGAAIRSEGHVAVFNPSAGGPCYRCLYNDAAGDEELSCSQSGVLAPMVGVIGSLQALEAVKLLAGFGEPIVGSMLVVDGWSLQVRRVKLKRDPQCPVCGSR